MLQISPFERLTFLGKTRSGKTVAARHLLLLAALMWEKKRDPRSQIFILATKEPKPPDFGARYFPGTTFAAVRGVHNVLKPAARIVVVYPTRAEKMDGGDSYEWFYDVLLDRAAAGRKGIVYTDEMVNVTEGRANGGPPSFRYLYQQGGGLNLGAWAGQQDAAFIERVALSQAEHYIIFPLRMPQDRAKMGGIMGMRELPERFPDKRGFWYSGPGEIRYYPDIAIATGVAVVGVRKPA